MLGSSGGPLKAGSSRVLFGVSDVFPIVSVVGLGKNDFQSDTNEERDEKLENIRNAVAGKVSRFYLYNTNWKK